MHAITTLSVWLALEKELLRTSNVDKVVLIKFLPNGKEEPVHHNKKMTQSSLLVQVRHRAQNLQPSKLMQTAQSPSLPEPCILTYPCTQAVRVESSREDE